MSTLGPRAAITSTALFAVAGGGFLLLDAMRSPVYATAIGEQRSIHLDDGSTIALNSRSKIRVRYSHRTRAVELLQGEALFNVAKDVSRPFIVNAGFTKVRAVGTAFDVDQRSSGTIVSVLEGRVAVLTDRPLTAPRSDVATNLPSSGGGVAPPPNLLFPNVAVGQVGNIVVSAGEQLSVNDRDIKILTHPNIEGATAWTHRQIVFDYATLADVAEQFNRYNHRQLVLDDPSLVTFHVSGVFSSSDSVALIRFLQSRQDLRIAETDSEIRISKK